MGDLLGLIFLLVPAAVLTLHAQKSEIVVGALAPGAIVLVLAIWAELQERSAAAWLMPALAAGVFIAGGTYFVRRQMAPAYDEAFLADAHKVAVLAEYVYARTESAGLKSPHVGVDYVTDCLDGQVLRVICYERHHIWVPFEMTLPISISEPPESLVFERLGQSDFVFLTENAPFGLWPFDQKLEALRPQLRTWCASHLQFVERVDLFGRRMALYPKARDPYSRHGGDLMPRDCRASN